MNKKYQIVNSNSNEDCTIFYLLYIVLFFVIIFIIYKVIFNFSNIEKFESVDNMVKSDNKNIKNVSDDDLLKKIENMSLEDLKKYADSNNSSELAEIIKSLDLDLGNKSNSSGEPNNVKKNIIPGKIISRLVDKNNELEAIKNIIEDKLKEQSQAIYISENYNKINSNSWEDELSFLLVDLTNTRFPEINMDGKKIVNSQDELNTVMSEVKEMKNFYKPGDIVTANSTFGITKNDICYRADGKPIKANKEFMSKFPDCMVCSVENSKQLTNTDTWKNTRTNINKVCLFNPAAESNSGIPNLKQCQNFCGVVSN
jgi:hypothetical protein